MKVRCARCGAEVPADEIYQVRGQELCEDCAMAASQGPRPCDVWAVRIATNTRRSLGQSGTEGLTPRQRQIYEYIKEQGGAPAGQIAAALGLTAEEVRREFAVLRHCELGRAEKRGRPGLPGALGVRL